MFRSLRARLLIWYTAILALVVAAFGTAVCYLTWRTRLADVDAVLRARSAALARALSPNDSGTFDLALPPGSADGSTDQTELPYHAVWSADGHLIDQTAPDLGRGIPMPGARTRGNEREVTIRTPDGVTILVGRSVASQRAELWTLAGGIAAVGLVALGLSLAGGWWLVGRALEPVDRISRTAHAMVQGDFAARIPVERVETELEQLADALNEAFDRLHTSIDRQRQFTADASHELRTPLATVAVETDWALARDRGGAEYRQSLEACQRAAGRMRTVVERLLRLASTESDAGTAATTPVHLDRLVDDVVRDLRPLAARRGLDLSATTEPIVVTGDAERLSEAVTNVVANAIQYNVDGGRVRVRLTAAQGLAEVEVADTGVGIAPADLPHVFDPFFRADPARSREAGGAGLGLTLTRAIVERHGGQVTCDSHPGQGTVVRIWLRPAPPAAPADTPTAA